MRFNTLLPHKLKPFFEEEMRQYRWQLSQSNWQKAWYHLERAHIIGQRYPFAHSQVHWNMLKFGFKIKDKREILGQLPRLFLGGVKSFVGKIPIGNPGGSNVPPLKSFPIDDEIKTMFKMAGL